MTDLYSSFKKKTLENNREYTWLGFRNLVLALNLSLIIPKQVTRTHYFLFYTVGFMVFATHTLLGFVRSPNRSEHSIKLNETMEITL